MWIHNEFDDFLADPVDRTLKNEFSYRAAYRRPHELQQYIIVGIKKLGISQNRCDELAFARSEAGYVGFQVFGEAPQSAGIARHTPPR
jgi:hypothetical protein